jgi:hypothetical protein
MIRPSALLFAAAVGAPLLAPSSALAQHDLTAVALAGDDANDCSRPAPCRTFARAVSQTNAGGVVVALDSGGYGPVVIDRSLTIEAADGAYAAVRVTAGDGIVVAPTAARVTLRGLYLFGAGTGTRGIVAHEGAAMIVTTVERCVIDGFEVAIHAQSGLHVFDTTIRSSTDGVVVTRNAAPPHLNEEGRTTLDGVRFATTRAAVDARARSNVVVRDSVVAGGTWGLLTSGDGRLMVDRCAIRNTAIAIMAQDTSAVRVSRSVVTDNTWAGLVASPTSVVESWGNNRILGNPIDVAGTVTIVGGL